MIAGNLSLINLALHTDIVYVEILCETRNEVAVVFMLNGLQQDQFPKILLSIFST